MKAPVGVAQLAGLLFTACLSIGLGYAFFPPGRAVAPEWFRFATHALALLVSFPLYWYWQRLHASRPEAALPAALGGPTLRFIAFFVYCGVVFVLARSWLWSGVVQYATTIGTFLCFQVVTQAYRKYPGPGS